MMYRKIAEPRNIVIFSGGHGTRDLARALCQISDAERARHDITYIIPTIDNGRSTGELRRVFPECPAFGDIRSRLHDLLPDPGHPLARILFSRLPEQGAQAQLKEYYLQYGLLRDPLFREARERSLDVGGNPVAINRIQEALNRYHQEFAQREGRLPVIFDYRGASIGNMILVGMFLGYYPTQLTEAAQAAVDEFALFAGINAQILVSSHGVHDLVGYLDNGERILGQDEITRGGWSKDNQRSISRISFMESPLVEPIQEVIVAPSDRVRRAIQDAHLIVLSTGSPWTSLAPSLCLDGMAELLARSAAPRVLIANTTSDQETRGIRSTHDLYHLFHRMVGRRFITHMIQADELREYSGPSPVIIPSPQSAWQDKVNLIACDLVTGDESLHYNSDHMVEVILNLSILSP